MVQESIVFGHYNSSQGLEINKGKIAIIEKLPCPISVKEVSSFLRHIGFYKRFIKVFSKIAKPFFFS